MMVARPRYPSTPHHITRYQALNRLSLTCPLMHHYVLISLNRERYEVEMEP